METPEKTKLKIIEIKFVKTKSESVLARADIHFDGFWLKGFKILRNKERKEYVTPPSYFAQHKGWRKLFETDSLEDWQMIQRRVLEDYNVHLMKESIDESYEREQN